MLRSLWYLFKVLSVIGVAIFLATQPGTVQVEWNDYTVTIHLGFVAVSVFALFLVTVYASGIAFRVTALPREFARYRKDRRRAKGYQALVRSLASAAAGDHKNAYYLAYRAQKLLPAEEAGIPLLLQAHAARGKGQLADMDQAYHALLGNAETALLGVQGLMQKAILQGDYPGALVLAREAVKAYPRSYSLLKAVYDLELRNHLWNDALVTLDLAQSKKVVPKDEAARDRVVLYLLLGDMARDAEQASTALQCYKKAYAIDDEFVPAVDRLARHYLADGRRVKALGIMKRAWVANPHPDYLPVWNLLVPKATEKQEAVRYRWFEWLLEFHLDNVDAILALARVAIEEGLWGEARAALVRAEKLEPKAELYRLWVLLEEKTTAKPDVIRQWLDRAAHAPAGKMWVCSKTGRSFPVWVAVVEPEGFFNTLTWGVPRAKPEEISAPLWLRGGAAG